MALLDQIHHRFYGPEKGRKWVFLHGLMGFLNNWRTIIAGLEPTERCLVYDQRGHGRSFKPALGYAPEDYADDLRALLDELGWEKVILVGHSMGARNGLNFCVRFPERVERFILEDIGPDARLGNSDYYVRMLGVVPVPFKDRASARAFFQHDFPRLFQTRDRVEMIAAFLSANLEDKPDGTVSWRFSPEAILASARAGEDDRWAEVRALRVPTLIIHGEKSRELDAATTQAMVDANPMIRSVTIEGAGHWVHADQPERFLSEIRSFAGLSPTA